MNQIEKAENDISELWKLLNFLTSKQKPQPIEPDNINQEKANKYNTFFARIGTKIQNELTNKCNKNPNPEIKKFKGKKFKFKEIKPAYVNKLINEIDRFRWYTSKNFKIF